MDPLGLDISFFLFLLLLISIIVDHFDFPKRRNKVYQGLSRDFYGLVRPKDLFEQFFFGGSFLYQILVILFVGGVELEQSIYPRALWTEAVDGFICTMEQQPLIFLGGQRVLHLRDLWIWVTQSVTYSWIQVGRWSKLYHASSGYFQYNCLVIIRSFVSQAGSESVLYSMYVYIYIYNIYIYIYYDTYDISTMT